MTNSWKKFRKNSSISPKMPQSSALKYVCCWENVPSYLLAIQISLEIGRFYYLEFKKKHIKTEITVDLLGVTQTLVVGMCLNMKSGVDLKRECACNGSRLVQHTQHNSVRMDGIHVVYTEHVRNIQPTVHCSPRLVAGCAVSWAWTCYKCSYKYRSTQSIHGGWATRADVGLV